MITNERPQMGRKVSSSCVEICEKSSKECHCRDVCVQTKSASVVNRSAISNGKSVEWLKKELKALGCAGFEENNSSSLIDDCFQASLPPLQKLCASLVLDQRYTSILNSLAFNNILKNICAIRTEYVTRISRPIVQKLMIHSKNMNIFNSPVDPVALGIPTYFEVISHPMDLGTVLSKLRGGQYRSVRECFQEVDLVFKNAMEFNSPEHFVHKMALEVRKDFLAEVKLAEEKCSKEVCLLKICGCFSIDIVPYVVMLLI
jgi:hypothetical protein